jgi:hypothetical protein
MDSFSAACIVGTFTVAVLVVAALVATHFATSANVSGDVGAFRSNAAACLPGLAAPRPPLSTPAPNLQDQFRSFAPSARPDAAADPLARGAYPNASLTDRVNLSTAPQANDEAGSGGRAAGARPSVQASVHASVQEYLIPGATRRLPGMARGPTQPRYPSARLARPRNAPEVQRRRALAQFPPSGRRGANPALPPLRRSNAVRVPLGRRSARVLALAPPSVHG